MTSMTVLDRLRQERLAAAQQAAVAHRPPDDPAQDVAAPLVRGQDAVGDEERDRPAVVGDHLVAEALGLERLGVVAQEPAQRLVDRREEVGVVVRQDALEDGREPLQAQARVDARERQRHARAVGQLVELHEDEVPDLQPARALLGVVRDAVAGPRRGARRGRSGSRCTGRRGRSRPSARSSCRRPARRRPSGPSAPAAGRSRRARSPRRPRRRSRSWPPGARRGSPAPR